MRDTALRELTIELNRRCCNSCLFCSSGATPDASSYLAADVAVRAARQAVDLGVRKVAFSGGEPLLHPDFAGILDSVAALPARRWLYTSGVVLYGRPSPFLNWTPYAAQLDRVVFNLQSTDPTVHDRLVNRQGAFADTFDSMSAALLTDLPVEVHVVPTALNVGTLHETVRELDRLGVVQVSFLHFVPQGRGLTNCAFLALRPEDERTLLTTLRAIAEDTSLRIARRFGIPFAGAGLSTRSCNAGLGKLVVRCDGSVLPCEALKDMPSYVLGSVHNSTIEELRKHAGKVMPPCLRRSEASGRGESCLAQAIYLATDEVAREVHADAAPA